MNYLMMVCCAALSAILGTPFLQSVPLSGQTPDGKQLSQQELVQMLDNMGLEPKKINDFVATILWHGDQLNISMTCSVMENGDYIELIAVLRTIDNPDTVSAEAWRKILAKNDSLGRCNFLFNEKHKKLLMGLKTRNIHLTASKLRKELETLATQAQSTQNLWFQENLQIEKKPNILLNPGPFSVPVPTKKEKSFTIEGKWSMYSGVEDGLEQTYSTEKTIGVIFTFAGEGMKAEQDSKLLYEQKYKIDNKNSPSTIDLFDDKGNMKYALVRVTNEDEFSICFPPPEQPTIRPKEFKSTAENKQRILRFRRVK